MCCFCSGDWYFVCTLGNEQKLVILVKMGTVKEVIILSFKHKSIYLNSMEMFRITLLHYRPRMQVGKGFTRLSVCPSDNF